VQICQFCKHSLPFGQKGNPDAPVVACALFFADQTTPLGPLNKRYHGVVAILQKFRKVGNCGPTLAGKSGDPK
jgi:hypothetical protein